MVPSKNFMLNGKTEKESSRLSGFYYPSAREVAPGEQWAPIKTTHNGDDSYILVGKISDTPRRTATRWTDDNPGVVFITVVAVVVVVVEEERQ